MRLLSQSELRDAASKNDRDWRVGHPPTPSKPNGYVSEVCKDEPPADSGLAISFCIIDTAFDTSYTFGAPVPLEYREDLKIRGPLPPAALCYEARLL
jgi:hypothetical protein